MPTGTRRTRAMPVAGRDDQPRTGFLRKDFIGPYRWMRGLVGANVVKKTVPRRNRRWNRLRTDRQGLKGVRPARLTDHQCRRI
jgi:hypothetical protein